MTFIDLVKAFDSVNREAIWRILELDGCPPKFINIIRLLHDNMNATFPTNHGPGEAFKITTGLKQGCVIAPTLFSMFLGTVLHVAVKNLPPGVKVTYRTVGKLFSLNRLRAKIKISATTVVEVQYADDNQQTQKKTYKLP